MQSKYIVTTELKTPILIKVLRFFRIRPKMSTFTIILRDSSFRKGDVLIGYEGEKLLIIKKQNEFLI